MGTAAKPKYRNGFLPTITDEWGMIKIDPNLVKIKEDWNVREQKNYDTESIKQSIKTDGLLQPIWVTPCVDEEGYTYYELEDGHRRLKAIQELIEEGAEIARIPAVFQKNTLTEDEKLARQIKRNQQKPNTPWEIATALKLEVEVHGHTVAEAIKILNLKKWGSIYYKIWDLPTELQEMIHNGTISFADVRRIITAHKGDVKAATKEISKAAKKLQNDAEKNSEPENKKTKVSLSDLDIDGKTIVNKDSKIALKGLGVIFKYFEKYAAVLKDKGVNLELSVSDIYNKLMEGKDINSIFADAVAEAVRNTQSAVAV